MKLDFSISIRRTDNETKRVFRLSHHNQTAMEILTKEEVSKIARKVEGGENFQLDHYELRNKSEETLGYLGKHLILTLYLTSEKGQTQRKLFLKTYEIRANSYDFLGETGIFKREQDFYRIVVENMKECVAKINWCPEYYFSKERVLVLEDLSEKGYKMVENRRGLWALDNVHLEKALKALASMHATSILLEDKESKSLPDLHPTIFHEEKLYDENKPDTPTRKWINWQTLDLLEGVDYLDKYSCDEKIIIKRNFEKQIMRIYTLSKKSEKYRNVLTHGDIWKNNLLFRYSEENNPKECKFVDFQFIRYAPPAHDIMHLLHYATKKETRDRKEHEFLNIYYDSLRKQLHINGVDVMKNVSREELVESCKKYKELALIQCLLSLHYLLGSVTLTSKKGSYEEYEDYLTNQRKKYMKKFFQNKLYVDKIKDIFHELIDAYILKN